MSAPQGNYACRITVDPSTADVLRVEAKKVLMFNHEPFEDFLDYVPAKQLALADIFRDATAVIDALGWDPDTTAPPTASRCRSPPPTSSSSTSAAATSSTPTSTCSNDIGADAEPNAIVMADIHANRHGVEAPQPRLRRLQRHDHDISRRMKRRRRRR